MENVQIKKENIPDFMMTGLAQIVAASVQNFFQDPEHRQEFETWKKEREEDADRNRNSNVLCGGCADSSEHKRRAG